MAQDKKESVIETEPTVALTHGKLMKSGSFRLTGSNKKHFFF